MNKRQAIGSHGILVSGRCSLLAVEGGITLLNKAHRLVAFDLRTVIHVDQLPKTHVLQLCQTVYVFRAVLALTHLRIEYLLHLAAGLSESFVPAPIRFRLAGEIAHTVAQLFLAVVCQRSLWRTFGRALALNRTVRPGGLGDGILRCADLILGLFHGLVELLSLRLLLFFLTCAPVFFRRAGSLHLLLIVRRCGRGVNIHVLRRELIRRAVLITNEHATVAVVLFDGHVHGRLRVSFGLHVDGCPRLTSPELTVSVIRLLSGTEQCTLNRSGVGRRHGIVAALGRRCGGRRVLLSLFLLCRCSCFRVYRLPGLVGTSCSWLVRARDGGGFTDVWCCKAHACTHHPTHYCACNGLVRDALHKRPFRIRVLHGVVFAGLLQCALGSLFEQAFTNHAGQR